MTGAVYACHAPEPSANSSELTPEPVSEAVTVTVAIPTYRPCSSFSPLTLAEVSGGVVSSLGGATTVKATAFSGAVLPALSVAR
ncbi:hypothetical protein GCM10014713_65750 [Streptomyces purpureus]|uniref:Uncharacterized protein n=1 Tax=Streptomyces purpureus TaxID=1951 RepID=A0A918LXF1_9ACTN|nr:hypothetical protein GCM10014713_65750 [Streptomyces purpureus]